MAIEALDNALIRMVENDDIAILFQPIVSAFQYNVIGFEALASFKNAPLFNGPEDVFHAPAGRISSDVLKIVDMHCLRKAIRLASRIPEEFMIFININGATVEKFLSIFRYQRQMKLLQHRMPIPPRRIVLEMGENTNPANIKQIMKLLKPFRDNGMNIAVDDVGIRYPWLGHFTWLQPEYVKIDRFFLHNAQKWKTHLKTMRGICNMILDTHTSIIGEGIETDTDIEFARTMGMEYLQGYKFSKPLPIEYWSQKLWAQKP